ncbi:MAG: aminoglycoside phosphotransferase family protein [Anaerolineae bacterium]|nr:aminoglycoside phosphotransferase family protein [Anaerolineae bacterium]MCO5190300.1 aminoglycoside phosphotransferase family protein [Anaerolineae bacterium]MCO5194254.1 aminoglycoside phosphotransferase family protein [Anaerolineae bacterium]MCO5199558.1 aminoglycoside phosphotransferase family protein [Anaerolineae bacterium]MCO5206039.1 aminoglycoside phosphotransferase family protein [Anaerolineae bacterium]
MKNKVSADWLALAADACADAGIDWKKIEPIRTMEQQFEDSTAYHNNTVLRIDDRLILKLFGPTQRRAFHVEQAVLQTLADHAHFPAPRLVAAAERPDSFPYSIMTAVGGAAPDRDWTGYLDSEKLSLAAEIGSLTRKLHNLPLDELTAVEAEQGGAESEIALEQTKRIAEIKTTSALTTMQRDRFLRFVSEEGHTFFDEPPVLTHADLSHAHIFVARREGTPQVTGFIDWGEALIGPATWDIAAHWFWSYTFDRPMMQACLAAYYPDGLPERLARRCLATIFYTFSMQLMWPHIVAEPLVTDDPIREMTERVFAPAIFGAPD